MTEKLVKIEFTEERVFSVYILFEEDDYPTHAVNGKRYMHEDLEGFAEQCLREHRDEARRKRVRLNPDLENENITSWEFIDPETEEGSFAHKHKAPVSVSRTRNLFLRAFKDYKDPYKSEVDECRLQSVGQFHVARQVRVHNFANRHRWITVTDFDLSYDAEGCTDLIPAEVASKLDITEGEARERLFEVGLFKEEES